MNPVLGASLATAAAAEPFTLTIFGASGDLTRRKLMPALYLLFVRRLLPETFAIVGLARREYNDDSFRAYVREALESHSRVPVQDETAARFLDHVFYHRADIEADGEAFTQYRARLKAERRPPNRLFYLSVKPELFPLIIRQLRESGLVRRPREGGWTRVIIEKPFGRDLRSALELNQQCLTHLSESQVYRIDHYLGKETAQNILSFRFANILFEPVFNHRYVDHVQITAAETDGIEHGRGGYYDTAGAVRDMVQNHLLQLLCLVAMEPPARMEAEAIRNEKVKVLQSVVPPRIGCVDAAAIAGQYVAGVIQGRPVPGYRQEERVAPDSRTPTYAALRLQIENWRWAGVPFYLRTGKRLAARATEIVVQFKVPPLQLFETVECTGDVCDRVGARPNRLIFRIQPSEGISLRFCAKRPEMRFQVEDVRMAFTYAATWDKGIPEAYERLLLDALRGDQTLFTRSDEVEYAWRIVEPVLQAWEGVRESPLYFYEAGSWGPIEAESLFLRTDTEWHVPHTDGETTRRIIQAGDDAPGGHPAAPPT